MATTSSNVGLAEPAQTTSDPDDTVRMSAPDYRDQDPRVDDPLSMLAEWLSAATEYHYVVSELPSSRTVAAELASGELDLAILDGIPAALASTSSDIDAFAAWPASEQPATRCVVFEDSPIYSLSEITEEDTVAFGSDPTSTTYHLAVHLLQQSGLTQHVDYQAHFSDSPTESIRALHEGIATVSCSPPTSPSPSKPGEVEDFAAEVSIRVLESSPPQPVSITLLGSTTMGNSKREAVLDALLQPPPANKSCGPGTEVWTAPLCETPIIEPSPTLYQHYLDAADTTDTSISAFP